VPGNVCRQDRLNMTVERQGTSIATWFVADKPGEETGFPQVGGVSSSVEFQNNYWRCIVCFFESSLRHNAGARHLLFTNQEPPIVEGVDLAALLRSWEVQIVPLPITYRLPRDGVKLWGNQFYILDIIKYVAADECADNLIVLDCDCVWMKSVDQISDAISRCGCLTYTLDDGHYLWDAPINGVTRQEMATALKNWTADSGINAEAKLQNTQFIHYHGGEIFAATKLACCDLASLIDPLWQWSIKNKSVRGIAEEAHFLSILYALRSYPNYTANVFLKRIWTTFHFNNVAPSDFDLVIWHLPAEKKTGFRRLFSKITQSKHEAWKNQSREDYERALARVFGIPHRSALKFLLDVSLKLTERAEFITRLFRRASVSIN
jgi:hypothetical protein